MVTIDEARLMVGRRLAACSPSVVGAFSPLSRSVMWGLKGGGARTGLSDDGGQAANDGSVIPVVRKL